MSIFKDTVSVNNQSANLDYGQQYDTNAGKFDSKSTWSKVWETATDSLQKSLGIFTGGSKQEVQAISQGVAEGTIQSIDNIKTITRYAVIGGLIVVCLIAYSKLK